mgnify:CR=1 FL=1
MGQGRPLLRLTRPAKIMKSTVVVSDGNDAEIGRMSEQLASGDLDKLATQNRFLELKYQEAKELGA